MGCGCKLKVNKAAMPEVKVKKSTKYPSHMPNKVTIICDRAGTTDPRELQRN